MMLRIKTTFVLAIRYILLTRYSLLMAIILVLLVPVSLVALPKLLANLFVFDLPEQMYHVSWVAMWCAVTVMETLRVTTLNAHLRFDDYRMSVRRFRQAWNVEEFEGGGEWYRTSSGWLTFVLGLVAAIAVWHLIIDACITETTASYSPETWKLTSEAAVRSECWKRAIAGLLTTLILIGVLNGLLIVHRERQNKLEANSDTSDDQPAWQRSLYEVLHFILGPGYFIEHRVSDPTNPPTLRFAPGHLRLVVYTIVFMVWHLVNYVSVRRENEMPTELSPYPALFYGLLTLLVLLYVLPGTAFYWDRYRIPVPLLFAVVVMVLYSVSETDHYYELDPVPRRAEAYDLPTLEEVYDEWDLPYDFAGTRTLVVVDASGGGIQASAWTAQVLTGLHERYGNRFSRSIGLISGVSGGSVGTMFYLTNRADLEESYEKPDVEAGELGVDVLPPEAISQIRQVSRASALEATAWGIAYPDLMRLIYAPAANRNLDRGWATEQVWRQRMSTAHDPPDIHSDLRLSAFTKACVKTQLPVPVFNATLMESGQRLQICPVRGPKSDDVSPEDAVEFLDIFPNSHPRVSTAARLSATFPYVTPASRSDHDAESGVRAYHVVDGAYVDNEGVVTSVDWIHRLLTSYSPKDYSPKDDVQQDGERFVADADEGGPRILDRPFERILLIRIQAFPKATASRPKDAPKPASGWRTALGGPLEAMMKVRSTSQIERGDLEINLLTQANEALVKAMLFSYEAKKEAAEAKVTEAKRIENALPDNASEQARQDAKVAREDAEAELNMIAEKFNKVDELQLDSILFDFQSPNEDVMIPLSWKLTKPQKDNVDAAWQSLVDDAAKPAEATDKRKDNPLVELDAIFDKDWK